MKYIKNLLNKWFPSKKKVEPVKEIKAEKTGVDELSAVKSEKKTKKRRYYDSNKGNPNKANSNSKTTGSKGSKVNS